MSCWSYSRCPDCPDDHRQVFPNGPLDAEIMIVGESPGVNEDRLGIPFVGRSGQELDQTYLRLAGLERSRVFVSNCVSCRAERGGVDVRPSPSLVTSCAGNHLQEEVWTVNPKIIILAGATACSLLPEIDLELEHGFPRFLGEDREPDFFVGWSGWVVPMYHPAAGMHETRYMTPLLEDWERLGAWRRGKWVPPNSVERLKGQTWAEAIKPQYRLIEPGTFWDLISGEPEHYEYLPVDTESDEGRLWSVQFSTRPGYGWMMRCDNKLSMEDFSAWQTWTYNGIVMHNAAHDLGELDQIGIRPRKIRDTMQELYALGNLPQGLKAAVYRTHGYRMHSYDETVTPHSRRVLEGWLAEATAHATSLRIEEPHPAGKDCPSCGKNHRKDMTSSRPHEAEAVLRRVMGKLSEEGNTYDPWEKPKTHKGVEKCRLLGRDWLPELESTLGRMPRRSIVHCPIEEAVRYGCSDADWTGRLAAWLEGERERIVREEWKVA